MFTEPFSTFTLPSMNIVPFTVSTFVEAFQESSPAEPLQVYDEAGVRFLDRRQAVVAFRRIRRGGRALVVIL